MRIIVCRKDYPLSGDPAIDRQRYRRGQVIDCLPDGAAIGESVTGHPCTQVIDVAGLTAGDAARLCMTDYQNWRAQLDDGYFANPDDPRRQFDDPDLYARRRERIDLDDARLPQAQRDRLALDADHRQNASLTRAQCMSVVKNDTLAVSRSLRRRT